MQDRTTRSPDLHQKENSNPINIRNRIDQPAHLENNQLSGLGRGRRRRVYSSNHITTAWNNGKSFVINAIENRGANSKFSHQRQEENLGHVDQLSSSSDDVKFANGQESFAVYKNLKDDFDYPNDSPGKINMFDNKTASSFQ